MRARSAITKGRSYQKKIANAILERLSALHLYNIPLDETDIHSAISAQSGSDVVMTTRVKSIFPFDVECKKTKKPDLLAAYRQSCQRENKHYHIVVAEGNRGKSVVFSTVEELDAEHVALTASLKGAIKTRYEWGASNEMSMYDMWSEDTRHNAAPVVSFFEVGDDMFACLSFELWLKNYTRDPRWTYACENPF